MKRCTKKDLPWRLHHRLELEGCDVEVYTATESRAGRRGSAPKKVFWKRVVHVRSGRVMSDLAESVVISRDFMRTDVHGDCQPIEMRWMGNGDLRDQPYRRR